MPTQQHGCHLLPHAHSALYVVLLVACCLGGLGPDRHVCFLGKVLRVRRAVGASPPSLPLRARLASLLRTLFLSLSRLLRGRDIHIILRNLGGGWFVGEGGGDRGRGRFWDNGKASGWLALGGGGGVERPNISQGEGVIGGGGGGGEAWVRGGLGVFFP